MKRTKLLKIVTERLSGKRLLHSRSTAIISERMAELLGVDPEKAFTAGLLHDIAKPFSNKELLLKAEKFRLKLDKTALRQPSLLHAPVGAAVVKNKIGIMDEQILEAIANHTTGDAGISPLALIVYAADFLDPIRAFPKQEKAWAIMDGDFYEGILYITRFTMKRVLRHWQLLHPKTVALYNEMQLKTRDKGRKRFPLKGITRTIKLEIEL